jgi:hypothetical protein
MSVDMLQESAPKFSRAYPEAPHEMSSVDYLDMPAFLRNQADVSEPGIPKPFRLLLALIEENPGRLDANGALKLLEEAGLKAKFHEVFEHAEHLGISATVIATIILAELLSGPLNEYLPDEAQRNLALLQEQARDEESLIEELGQRGIDLLHLARKGASRNMISPKTRESLERFAGFRGLLDHAKHWVKHVVAKGGSGDQRP